VENSTLTISGISCQGCADSLCRLFDKEPGISSASVSFEKSAAELKIDSDHIQKSRLSEIVEAAGFTVQ